MQARFWFISVLTMSTSPLQHLVYVEINEGEGDARHEVEPAACTWLSWSEVGM